VNAARHDEEGVGPALQQQLRCVQLPHLRGEVQGRHARFVRRVHFSACVQQLAGGVDVAVAGSVVQRCAAVALRNNKRRQRTLGGRRVWQGGGGGGDRERRADAVGAESLAEQLQNTRPLLLETQTDEEASVVVYAHLRQGGRLRFGRKGV
jgi:hypothetical protein